MSKSGKAKSIEKANKLLEERAINGNVNESNDLSVGTPIIILDGKVPATIVKIKYLAKLNNGKLMFLEEGEFYNNTPDDGLPF